MSKLTHFKREWLKGCKIIKEELTRAQLIVASTVSEKNLIRATEPGKNDRYIVTFKAIAEDKLARLKEVFTGKDMVPIEDMKNIFLTGSIWINDPANPPSLPLKGEQVLTNIGYVPMRDDKDKFVLRVTAMSFQPTRHVEELDVDNFFDDIPMGEDAEELTNVTRDELSHEDITH